VEVAVRPATPDDTARLEVLLAAAIAEQVDGRGGRVWSQREALRKPEGERTTLAGTIDDVIVGYAEVGVETLADGSLLGVVTAIYVEGEAREVAVGEALLDEVIAWCTAKGCAGIDAHALPGNRETKNFFETFGFTARLLVVHRSLS
jgi:ribosomal protein S18 acetylase RimI-like enzyme